ncbi:unnamed protein product [Ascophyllum nodosum]
MVTIKIFGGCDDDGENLIPGTNCSIITSSTVCLLHLLCTKYNTEIHNSLIIMQ